MKKSTTAGNNSLSFWRWLLKGSDSERAGIRAYWNKWLLLHAAIATILAWNLKLQPSSATSLCIPFISVLIAITVAWSGNIISLLNTEEITELSTYYHGGIEGYAFNIQSTVLMLFIAIIIWTLYGFEFFSYPWIPLFISSIVLRDCWNVILFAQLLTITRAKIAIHKKMCKNNELQSHSSTISQRRSFVRPIRTRLNSISQKKIKRRTCHHVKK